MGEPGAGRRTSPSSCVIDEFDLTLMLPPGRRPRPDRAAVADVRQAEEWPVKVIPLAVNVTQFPRLGNRCWELGEAIARCRRGFPEDLNVQIWGPAA